MSRHDPSIVVTIHGRAPSGLWNCSAPSDRVTELISEERLVSDFRPVEDGDDPVSAVAAHEARRGSPRRRTGEDRARRNVPDDRVWEFAESE